MQILVLEDEKIAAQNIINLVSAYFNNEVLIQWVQSVEQGLNYLDKNGDPDLILSDIELLDGQAFSLYEQYEVVCPIIFTTAYDQFLLKAFQTNGIAYLLKPFSADELTTALDKYLKLFKSQKQPQINASLLTEFKEALASNQKKYKKRFTIKKTSGIILLETKDIAYFTAKNDLIYAVDLNSKKHVLNNSLSDIEKLVNPSEFFRINRAEIINIKFVERMENYFGNRLAIKLKNMNESLKTSGPKTAAFRKWVED